jgi:hypothetical protein
LGDSGVGLSPANLIEIFPFHVVYSYPSGQIIQHGRSFSRLFPSIRMTNSFFDLMKLESPPSVDLADQRSLLQFQSSIFLFSSLTASGERVSLKGMIQVRKSKKIVVFFGYPLFSSVLEAAKFGLSIGDFSPIDPATEFLFENAGRNLLQQENVRLEKLITEKRMASKDTSTRMAGLGMLLGKSSSRGDSAVSEEESKRIEFQNQIYYQLEKKSFITSKVIPAKFIRYEVYRACYLPLHSSISYLAMESVWAWLLTALNNEKERCDTSGEGNEEEVSVVQLVNEILESKVF